MPDEFGNMYNFELEILDRYMRGGNKVPRKSIWIHGYLFYVVKAQYVSALYKEYSNFCKSPYVAEMMDGTTINPGDYQSMRTTIYTMHQLGLITRVNPKSLPEHMMKPIRGMGVNHHRVFYMLSPDYRQPYTYETFPDEWLKPLRALARQRGWTSKS